MTAASCIYATITIDNEKLQGLVKKLAPDIESGKVTYEEVMQGFQEMRYDLWDVKISKK